MLMYFKVVRRCMYMIIMYFIFFCVLEIDHNANYSNIFLKVKGKGNYANGDMGVGMNTIWWVQSRHFDLIGV